MSYDSQLKVRCEEELLDMIDAAAEKQGIENKSELIRRTLRQNLDAPIEMRISSLKKQVEKNREKAEEKEKKIKELKERRRRIEENFEEIRGDIKEYLTPIFKEAERKNEPLKYRKEGLIEQDLPEKFGIIWDNESKAVDLIRSCNPIDYEDIEPEIEDFLDSLIEENTIRDIEEVEG